MRGDFLTFLRLANSDSRFAKRIDTIYPKKQQPHKHMNLRLNTLLTAALSLSLQAGEAEPALAMPGKLVVDDNFERAELGKGWAQTSNGLNVSGSHADFATEKPNYRFVMKGRHLLIDDLKIWELAARF